MAAPVRKAVFPVAGLGIGPKRLQPRSEALLDGALVGCNLCIVCGRHRERHKREHGQ